MGSNRAGLGPSVQRRQCTGRAPVGPPSRHNGAPVVPVPEFPKSGLPCQTPGQAWRWYASQEDGLNRYEVMAVRADAKEACNTSCPIRTACLAFALANNEEHGVWGGTDGAERKALLGNPALMAAATGNRVSA